MRWCAGDDVLPAPILDVVRAGQAAGVALMVGNNGAEWTGLVAAVSKLKTGSALPGYMAASSFGGARRGRGARTA